MNTLRPGNYSTPPPRWRDLTRRHGITSILAMLYLVLFSTLAIGFYTATTTVSYTHLTLPTILRV